VKIGGLKSSKQKTVCVEPGSVEFVSDSGKKSRAGRPNSLSEEKLQELLEVYYSRPFSLREIADIFGVSRMTVWRAVQSAATF
jgi:transposase